MRFPCEDLSKIVIPAIRALIVKVLNENYGKNQIEIAKLMGLTQPSVSYYLRGERGAKGASIIKETPHYQTVIEIAEKLINETASDSEMFKLICNLCADLRTVFIEKMGLDNISPLKEDEEEIPPLRE